MIAKPINCSCFRCTDSKATRQEVHSVISAEATTMALAAVVLHRMNHH
jgi:hypothetical protein